jgi:hypothetical protein
MKKSRKLSNYWYVVQWSLAFLPIVLVAFSTFRNGTININDLSGILENITNINWLIQLKHFVKNTFFGTDVSLYVDITINYFTYLFLLTIVDLIYYLLTFIFRYIKKFVGDFSE